MVIAMKIITIFLFICILIFPCAYNAHSEDIVKSELIKKYSPSIALLEKQLQKKGFKIEHLFSHPKFEIYNSIDSLFINSAEKKALQKGGALTVKKSFIDELEVYKKKIGFETKIKGISGFVEEYAVQLSLCEEKYGIPKEIITSVIGIESNFGTITGRHNPFNVYISMYVKNYRRKFAVSQLEELLKFTAKNNQDVFELSSSYAGAIGYMQFLPYSLNKWFVGDDVYDMNNSIASVANFLSYHKKRRGTLEKAIYKYNPNKYYVKAVVDLASYAN
ncbi:MAG: hypothetical protein HOC71_08925 [Candidatus Latescibacteria bacterium]|jgi:membrane-bound lytic murein transglycosylase B|nr:hypothetical protein [Candidatus Latescibacterota bacterium]